MTNDAVDDRPAARDDRPATMDDRPATRDGAAGSNDPAPESSVSTPDEFEPSAVPTGENDLGLQTPPRELLAELLVIPSPSGDETVVLDRLEAFFAAHGRETSRDAAGNLHAPGDDAVLLTSHADRVAGDVPVRFDRVASEAAPWGGEPVGTGESVPVLHGRGSVDATGPLAAMAAVAAATGGSFAAVVREETDSAGARELVRSRPEPEAVINGEPSGWDAVTLAYRGLVRATYTVEEPSAHSSRPEPNAIQQATAWWTRIEQAFADDGPVAERVTATPTAFDGETTGLATRATIEASFRVPIGGSTQAVREAVAGVTDAGSLTWHDAVPPVAASPRTAPAAALRAGIRAADGEPRHLRKTGTADANHYAAAWDAPVVTYGPGDSALDHTPDERLPLPAFDRAVRVLADAVDRLR